ncbi:hypothetical protein ACH4SK_28000 [Streptomyces inhibens]|uniref:hypothetical protein n=1 Tax=Streptomyces inhibens TaxID=2293571 RepID=UPI003787AB57
MVPPTANLRADLARDCGYPEGSTGADLWASFGIAQLPGPGYAWPLVAHKLPTVHKTVRNALDAGQLALADHGGHQPAGPRGRPALGGRMRR